MVSIDNLDKKKGVIEERFPRKNCLIRPKVANVDQAVVVMSLAQPEPDRMLLDRLLIMVEDTGISSVICFNKIDLKEPSFTGELPGLYEKIGYKIIVTSAKTGVGKRELLKILKGKISVFTGPSGVGKSSLLNLLQEGFHLSTGSVSKKGGRGRHTTRHVELLELESGGWVADTPGFSRIYLPLIEREKLAFYFPEMLPHIPSCKFKTCLHDQEPGCAVKKAVEEKKIDKIRYEHYLKLLEEIISQERSF